MFRLDESDMAYGLTTVKYTVAFKQYRHSLKNRCYFPKGNDHYEKTLTQLKYGDIFERTEKMRIPDTC